MKSDELFALLRRRGLFWPSAEIYGGAQGLFDYGPLGAAFKRRIEEAWAAWFLGLSEDYYRIEPAEIVPEAVVRASGHLENFTDPEVTCAQCGRASRAETLLEATRPNGIDGLAPEEIGALLASSGARCPTCGSDRWAAPRPFLLMFGLDLGPAGRERAYLRPETAQSSFLAFDRMRDVGRKAMPLGVAVVGRAYRNEIAPRQLLFRQRAFTQAELQIFFEPGRFEVPFADVADEPLPILTAERREAGEATAEPRRAGDLVGGGLFPAFYVYHLAQTVRFVRDVLGVPEGSLRLLEKSAKERAFYNRIQIDVEVRLDSLGGYKELGAVHYRGDFDLRRHSEGSGRDLSVRSEGGARFVPEVLELTFGVDRAFWALADLGLTMSGDRTVWRLPPYLAPVTVGVLPLLKREHGPAARALFIDLVEEGFRADYDASGSIGRRYARLDEAGTPFAVTVDGESVVDGALRTVTLRERDSTEQVRVDRAALLERLRASTRFPRPRVSEPPAAGPATGASG